MNNDKNIYFDYQATTPVDPRVLDKMLPFLKMFMETLIQETILLDGRLKKPWRLLVKMFQK